ncbi:MAG: SDR family oxidoreductase [Hyphomicrobiaceae bacterium]|nr:SDR family oxidoreductase [Hyphomicrobiaceae bacterium]
MSIILVIGASQGIGLETVRALLADGHNVRAFARSAARIPISDPRLEKIAGDALVSADVARALEGVDAVVQCLGVPMTLATWSRGTTLFSRATRVLVDLMRERGPRRLICVTGVGAGDSRGRVNAFYDALMFPLILKRLYDDKDVQERIVKDSHLDWTIARPGVLVSAPVTGRYRALDDPKQWELKTIARADVARFLADEIGSPRFIRKTPLVIQ